MIKLNIQRFGHTNSTPNYELPQFVGTDKPQWLTDINQGFLTIDTAIHNAYALASLTSTNLGDISDLTTTVKTDVVSAVNEINGGLGNLSSTVASHTTAIGNNTTAIGNLADLDTVDKGDLVGAINEVDLIATNNATHIGNLTNLDTVTKTDLVNAINEVVNKFNINNFIEFDMTQATFSGGSYISGSGNLRLATNSDYSILKIYGKTEFTPTAYVTSITFNNVIPASYRPSSRIAVEGLVTVLNESNLISQSNGVVYFETDGSIVVQVASTTNSLRTGITLAPCVIFLKDFGDTPINN